MYGHDRNTNGHGWRIHHSPISICLSIYTIFWPTFNQAIRYVSNLSTDLDFMGQGGGRLVLKLSDLIGEIETEKYKFKLNLRYYSWLKYTGRIKFMRK